MIESMSEVFDGAMDVSICGRGSEVGVAVVNRCVSWGEAALVVATCWMVSGLGYGLIAVLDEPQLSVAPLIGLGLVQWFWARCRSWLAAAVAGVAGVVVLFGLVDILRPELGRYVADSLSTGVAATVIVAVLTLVGRGKGRRDGAAIVNEKGTSGMRT